MFGVCCSVNFLKDNNLRVVGMGLFEIPVTHKKEASVRLDSKEALEKAMNLFGTRISQVQIDSNQIFYKKIKNW